MIASQHEMLAPSSAPVPSNPQDLSAGPGPVGRVLYGASYYLSFGVTFPALLVANLIPRHSVVRQGLRDGATDAAVAQRWVQARTSAAAVATRDSVGNAYAHAAARVSERVETIQDAIAERKYRRRIALG